jgi:hypothetical protein
VSPQNEFDFNQPQTGHGYEDWIARRKLAHRELALKLGLPVDHPVEVWLRGDVRLRGTLRLQEERLFLDHVRHDDVRLEVDGVAFQVADMESCVRTD